MAAAFLLQAHWYNRPAVKELLEAARRAADVAHQPRCTLEPYDLQVGGVGWGKGLGGRGEGGGDWWRGSGKGRRARGPERGVRRFCDVAPLAGQGLESWLDDPPHHNSCTLNRAFVCTS